MPTFKIYNILPNLIVTSQLKCFISLKVFMKNCQRFWVQKKSVPSPINYFCKENWLFQLRDHIDFILFAKIEINIFGTESDSQYISLFLSTNISTKFERLQWILIRSYFFVTDPLFPIYTWYIAEFLFSINFRGELHLEVIVLNSRMLQKFIQVYTYTFAFQTKRFTTLHK